MPDTVLKRKAGAGSPLAEQSQSSAGFDMWPDLIILHKQTCKSHLEMFILKELTKRKNTKFCRALMFISNQKKSARSTWKKEILASAGTKESPSGFSLRGNYKEKAQEGKDKTGTTWLFSPPSRLVFFSWCGWPSVSLTWRKAMISARPSEHPEKPYFTWYQWRGEKKAHLRGDVLVVHIMSDVAAAGLVHRDQQTLLLKRRLDLLIRVCVGLDATA